MTITELFQYMKDLEARGHRPTLSIGDRDMLRFDLGMGVWRDCNPEFLDDVSAEHFPRVFEQS